MEIGGNWRKLTRSPKTKFSQMELLHWIWTELQRPVPPFRTLRLWPLIGGCITNPNFNYRGREGGEEGGWLLEERLTQVMDVSSGQWTMRCKAEEGGQQDSTLPVWEGGWIGRGGVGRWGGVSVCWSSVESAPCFKRLYQRWKVYQWWNVFAVTVQRSSAPATASPSHWRVDDVFLVLGRGLSRPAVDHIHSPSAGIFLIKILFSQLLKRRRHIYFSTKNKSA